MGPGSGLLFLWLGLTLAVDVPGLILDYGSQPRDPPDPDLSAFATADEISYAATAEDSKFDWMKIFSHNVEANESLFVVKIFIFN